MPATKAQRSAAARKGAATRKRHATEHKQHEQVSPIERGSELSEEVPKSLESGQRAAIEAVRKFVDTVDGVFPDTSEDGPRRKIIDSAFKMVEQLVGASNDFAKRIAKVTEDMWSDHERKAGEAPS